MSARILSATVLLLAVYLCFQISAANRRHPNKGFIRPCCTTVSTENISQLITGKLRVQKARGKCVDALIFPVKGGKACVDPKAEWVYSLKGKTTTA